MVRNDDLGIRMKENYENRSKTKLIRRMPVAIRIDGKAFHSFTRGFKRPFDDVLIKTMQETTKYLCENIQGCVLGYTQSDEITLILVDYSKLDSQAWFDYEVQKLTSISASMATMAFNKFFRKNLIEENYLFTTEFLEDGDFNPNYKNEELLELWTVHSRAIDRGAMFDSRCFNIPKEEVTNLIYWRQLDASRNSIQMVGQANFSHKQLHGKSCNDIQDMLMLEKGINWNDFPIYQKRGTCIVKNVVIVEKEFDGLVSAKYKTNAPTESWIIDTEIPIFKGEGRNYIDEIMNQFEL